MLNHRETEFWERSSLVNEDSKNMTYNKGACESDILIFQLYELCLIETSPDQTLYFCYHCIPIKMHATTD